MIINQAIMMAGGRGLRMAPISNYLSKHLIPLYDDKVVIDFPINTLKHLGVKQLIIVLGSQHCGQIFEYLKDGKHLGLEIIYVYQDQPLGISHGINLCKSLIDGNFITILGDNCYQNPIGWEKLDETKHNPHSAMIALTKSSDLHRFGVASISDNKIIKLEEKPKAIDISFNNYAITGCYLFTPEFFNYFEKTKPSLRGEYEIVSVIQQYLDDDLLSYSIISGWWNDAGSHSSINYIRQLVKTDPVVF